MSKLSPGSILSLLVAAGLLVGMGIHYRAYPNPSDAAGYHAEVLAATQQAPVEFDRWTSRPVELPPSAVELLRPNAFFSRSFINPQAGLEAGFLIVQVKDARDLSGHWPPNCYKANGYTSLGQQHETWRVGDLDIPGVEYEFEITTAGRRSSIAVANFMILPGVGVVPDMYTVREAGADHRRRYFGAAQVQVVVDANYPPDLRRALVQQLVEPYLPLIRRMLDLPADS